MNRWIAGAHFGKDLFSGNAAIMPHTGLRRIEHHSRSERAFVDAA
jgi:hypothetical protein